MREVASRLVGSVRRRVIAMYAALIAANIAAWVWALVAFHDYPVLLGTAALAYTFGLRHAIDADHIAAIDNVTRKLMQEGQRPIATGFFFSLGHSTIVVVLSIIIAASAAAFRTKFDGLTAFGNVAGTLISAFFLFAIAAANVLVFLSIHRAFRDVRRGQPFAQEDLSIILASRGMLGRLFRRFFRLVEHSWHMYPLGVLFGLGFDTATEVGLLGISATQAAKGMSIWSIMVFPALFTAGMSLLDATDGILMVGAYGWAFVKPVRKLYYNLTITALSVVVAIVVGGLEVLNLVGDQLGLTDGGGFWGAIGMLNGRFGTLGIVIIGIFAAGWIVSFAIYRMRGYDDDTGLSRG